MELNKSESLCMKASTCVASLGKLTYHTKLCGQMNFLGIESSGTGPNSLRKGPFSNAKFKQSPKQTWYLPKRLSGSTLKGYLIFPPHFL